MLLVNIDVDDLARAERFYTTVLPLRVGRRLDGAIELLGASSPIYLLEKAEGSPTPHAVRRYARHWTPVHLDFLVEDVDAAVERAVAGGATLEAPPKDAPWGRIAMLADPFGHGLCLLTLSDVGYDAIAIGG